MAFSYQSANSILYRTNGTNTSPSKPTQATSTSPTSISPTSPAAAVLHPSTPPLPTPPLQTQTPITPTLNRSPNKITTITTATLQRSSNSHQISPMCPSAQCPSSPRLPSTQIRTRIDYPRGIHVESAASASQTRVEEPGPPIRASGGKGRINQFHTEPIGGGCPNKLL